MEYGCCAKSTPSHTDRLASFADCRSDNIIATSYAAAGFSYAAQSGYIRCDECGLTLHRCDIHAYGAVSLHKTYAPSCKFLATTDSTHFGTFDYFDCEVYGHDYILLLSWGNYLLTILLAGFRST